MDEVTGVMIMKDGKAWGVTYRDGNAISYGWVDPLHAPIHNPKYLKKPEDTTYANSPYVKELRTGKLVKVKRTTTVEIID